MIVKTSDFIKMLEDSEHTLICFDKINRRIRIWGITKKPMERYPIYEIPIDPEYSYAESREEKKQ